MRKDYSAPVVTMRPARRTVTQQTPSNQEKKRVDYSHLDIIAEAERIIERRLIPHTRTSGKFKCQCPFDGCTSKQDAFLVFDRPELEEGQVHYWCNRCNRRGSLIDLLKELKGYTFKEACEDLRIDSRTWRVIGADSDQQSGQSEAVKGKAEQRRQQTEQTRKAEQAEIDLLGAWHVRARAWLAAGHITMKDGRQIVLDQARAYLQERGFSLEQASALGIAYIPTAKEFPEIAEDQKLAPWRGRVLFPLAGPKSVSGYAGRSLFLWKPGMSAEQHKKRLDAWNEKYKDEWTKQVQRYYKTRQAAYYGYERACQVSTLVIVEGEFDAASVCLALGDTPDIAVCAFGKNFQARQIPLNVLRVILALDLDQAGQEAIERQRDELETRGVTVEVARPAAGKDWNDCLIQAGADAILATIAGLIENNRESEHADAGQQRIEPPGYESSDICLICGQQVEDREGAFYVCEDKASEFYGDMFCASCWVSQSMTASVEQSSAVEVAALAIRDQGEKKGGKESMDNDHTGAVLAHMDKVFDSEHWPEPYTLTLLPVGMSSADYIERWRQGERPGSVIRPATMESMVTSYQSERTGESVENHHCKKHGKPLMYSDEMGGRYCDHVDCWERYRLIRSGARRGYSALVEVNKNYMHLADTSKEPLYYIDIPGKQERMPVYPNRPPAETALIEAGADAWRAYVAGRGYQDIDQAIRALASA